MKIGILGSGRFGELTYNTLKDKNDVKIYSRSKPIDNVKFFSLEEVCACDIVIPCNPISAFEDTIKLIADKLNPGSLVIDVCSVKIHPAEVMSKLLPQSVDILATHPMFGPDSTKNGTAFENLKFVYYPIRITNQERYTKILEFLKSLKLNMIELTPEEHDKQAAFTHAYAFLVGKIGMEMGIVSPQVTTKGFDMLYYNQTAVSNDTGQLFEDMMKYNPYVKEMLEKYKVSANSVIDGLLR